MRTSAVGSNAVPAYLIAGFERSLAGHHLKRSRLLQGFTLLELLVVLAIIAIATGGASLALRDSSTTALEREGERLAALLESGRSKSRATGLAIIWQTTEGGFAFFTAAPHPRENVPTPGAMIDKAIAWQDPAMRVIGATPVLLGPEPIIAAQAITLAMGDRTVRIASDGLRPFAVSATAIGVP